MEKYREVEKSIIKRYRKQIWSQFIKGIKAYELIKEGDKIAVCISGGKDSMLLAKCMQELKRHGQFEFDVKYIVMDPGYSEKNRNKILENAKLLNIEVEIFKSNIFEVAEKLNKESPCYMCARMRRGFLYNKAKELGCNKIALGHHFDDVIETILLSMLYGGEIKTMMPKVHSDHFEQMELIRPLYLVKEKDIITWRDTNELTFLNCACRFTESCAVDESKSKRKEMKKLVEQFRKTSSYIESNIFRSVENVNQNAIVGYKLNGQKHHFLDAYDQEKTDQ